MKRPISFLLILFAICCYGQDFSTKDTLTQEIDATDVHNLIIECYCTNGVAVETTTNKAITVNIEGLMGSVGYHGEQEALTEIPEETLSFTTECEGNTVRLVSKEWVFMHHSFVLTDVQLQIPEGITYEIKKIPGNLLEGRNVE